MRARVLAAAFVVLAGAGAAAWLLLASPPPASRAHGKLAPLPPGARELARSARIVVGPAPRAGAREGEADATPGGHGLEGTVVDATTAKPIAGASVVLRASGVPGAAVQRSRADALGRFALPELAPGRYEVVAVAEGWLVPDAALATIEAGRLTRVEIPLVAGLDVSGKVVAVDGGAVAGATIDLEDPLGRAGPSPRPVTSGADGSFRARGAPPGGGSRLRVSAPGYARAVVRLKEIVAPGLSGVTVALVRGSTVRGRVLGPSGEPAAGATAIAALLGETVERFEAKADASGAFVWDGLADGSYAAMALGEDGAASLAPAELQLGGGAPSPDVVLRLVAPGEIHGRVVDDAGAPLAGTSIVARREGPSALRDDHAVTADARGEFVLGKLAGTFTVSAARPGFARASRPGVAASGAPLELVLSKTGALGGLRLRLAGPDGKPLAGAEVHVESLDGDEAGRLELRTDDQGSVDAGALGAGRYRIALLDRAPDGSDELRVRLRDVAIEPGKTADLAPEPESAGRGTIAGRVVLDPAIAAAEPAHILLRPSQLGTDAFALTTSTRARADGSFELRELPAGKYRLTASVELEDGREVAGEARAEVEAGGTARVDVAVPVR